MTNYVDVEELKTRVYFESATLDPRFVFEEIEPDPSVAEVVGGVWFDGLRRFVFVGCAHRAEDRDGDLCAVCGETPEPKASAKSTARKKTK